MKGCCSLGICLHLSRYRLALVMPFKSCLEDSKAEHDAHHEQIGAAVSALAVGGCGMRGPRTSALSLWSSKVLASVISPLHIWSFSCAS